MWAGIVGSGGLEPQSPKFRPIERRTGQSLGVTGSPCPPVTVLPTYRPPFVPPGECVEHLRLTTGRRTDGRIMSALPPKADIIGGCAGGLLLTQGV